jgi:hypothetical protein
MQPSLAAEEDAEAVGMVKVADTKTGKVQAIFKAHCDTVSVLRFDSSGMLLAVADRNGNDVLVYHLGGLSCRRFAG